MSNAAAWFAAPESRKGSPINSFPHILVFLLIVLAAGGLMGFIVGSMLTTAKLDDDAFRKFENESDASYPRTWE